MERISGQSVGRSSYRAASGNDHKSVADKRISDLMKQSKQLSEQIDSVNLNKNLDSKIRMERVNALQEQMQQIEAQISQIRAEQISKQQEKDEEKASNQTTASDQSDMDVVIKISINFDQVKAMDKTKGQMERDSDTLKNSIRSDRHLLEINTTADAASKSAMKQNLEETVVKAKQETINKIENNLDKLNGKIDDAYEDIRNTVEQAREEDNKAEEADASEEVENETKIEEEEVAKDLTYEELVAEEEKKEERRSGRSIDIRV